VTPPIESSGGLDDADALICGTFCKKLGIEFGDNEAAYRAFQLPISHGGLGFRRYTTIASGAFLASVAASIHTMHPLFLNDVIDASRAHRIPSGTLFGHMRDAYDNLLIRGCDTDRARLVLKNSFAEFIDELATVGAEAVPRHFQNMLTALVETHTIANPPNSITDAERIQDRVRAQSAGAIHASAWLLAVPTGRTTTLRDSEFRTATRLRLDLPIPSRRAACNCGHTLTQSSADTHHFLLCPVVRNISLFARHERMVACVKSLASAAGVTIKTNVRDIARFGDNRQPDLELTGIDLRIITDVSISHPIQRRFLAAGNVIASVAATDMEERKARKYTNFAQEYDYKVIPFVLETYGASGRGVKQIIEELAEHAYDTFGTPQDEFTTLAWCAVSVALQAGNALALRNAISSARGRVPAAALDI
jgi:hypothetical protein